MLEIIPLEAFDDNYIWLLKKSGESSCSVVDPGDETPVLEYLEQHGLELEAILVTHRHGDHTGGIADLKKRWPNATVYGPAHEIIARVDNPVSDGDVIRLSSLGVEIEVMEVPGHTEGHVAYITGDALFCGDTLFTAGCGRVFTGTFEQLSDSLERLSGLSGDTRVYCAHEYTLANLGFAKWVEPGNTELQQREIEDRERRAHKQPTVPSTLTLELATNPFMRTAEATVIRAAENWAGQPLADRHQVFRALREWKDKDYD